MEIKGKNSITVIAKTVINLRAGRERKKTWKDDCKLWQEECIDWLSALMAFNFPDWLSTLSLWWMREGFNHNSQPDETHTCTHTDNTSQIQRKIHAVTYCIKKFASSLQCWLLIESYCSLTQSQLDTHLHMHTQHNTP